MSEKILVVEAMSSAFNFLEDIRNRGYEPVIVEPYIPSGYARSLMDEERKIKYARIPYPIRIIKEDPDYRKTLEEIRRMEPFMIIPGGEEGVVLGTRLADSLGLVGNPYANIDKMTKKSVMQESLKAAGLRHIRGEVVASGEDCIRFLEETGMEDVVLKHVHGVASVGVHLCHGRDEVLAAFEKESSAENMFGEAENKLMIQERIFGVEYVVNTVSREGVPALTSVLKYYKKKTEDGAIIYQGLETVNGLDEEQEALVEYAFAVVKALGIVNGPVHGEYMVDEHGPVLIEANCRVMGGSVPPDYMDKIFGHHETDIVLDSMLSAGFHRAFREKRYRPLRKGFVKDFSSANSKHVTHSGIIPIVLNLESYHSGWLENAGKVSVIGKTIDLETETGCVYLLHENADIVKSEFEMLNLIEDKFPELFYSDKPLFRGVPDFDMDTEYALSKMISYYRNGCRGTPVIPQSVIDADPYNRRIVEVIRNLAQVHQTLGNS